MIVQKIDDQIEISVTNVKSSSFGIDDSAIAHILGILRKDMYSDPHLAIVREYYCNAVDASNEVGKSARDVTITLPSHAYNYLEIEDRALGLTADRVFELLTRYGGTTKTGDNNSIGGFGIGFKSAFSLYDQFNVISRKDGIENIFLCTSSSIDNDDGKGSIVLLHTAHTDEPNGIKIQIPVSESDFETYEKKLKYLLIGHEHDNFPVILRDNMDISGLFKCNRPNIVKITENVYHNVHLTVDVNAGETLVFIGKIPYKIKRADFIKNSSVPGLSNVYFHFDVGQLDIPASRETIMLSTRNIKTLSDAYAHALSVCDDVIKEEFSKCNNVLDQKRLFLIFLSPNCIPYKDEYNAKFKHPNGEVINHEPIKPRNVKYGSDSLFYTDEPLYIYIDAKISKAVINKLHQIRNFTKRKIVLFSFGSFWDNGQHKTLTYEDERKYLIEHSVNEKDIFKYKDAKNVLGIKFQTNKGPTTKKEIWFYTEPTARGTKSLTYNELSSSIEDYDDKYLLLLPIKYSHGIYDINYAKVQRLFDELADLFNIGRLFKDSLALQKLFPGLTVYFYKDEYESEIESLDIDNDAIVSYIKETSLKYLDCEKHRTNQRRMSYIKDEHNLDFIESGCSTHVYSYCKAYAEQDAAIEKQADILYNICRRDNVIAQTYPEIHQRLKNTCIEDMKTILKSKLEILKSKINLCQS